MDQCQKHRMNIVPPASVIATTASGAPTSFGKTLYHAEEYALKKKRRHLLIKAMSCAALCMIMLDAAHATETIHVTWINQTHDMYKLTPDSDNTCIDSNGGVINLYANGDNEHESVKEVLVTTKTICPEGRNDISWIAEKAVSSNGNLTWVRIGKVTLEKWNSPAHGDNDFKQSQVSSVYDVTPRYPSFLATCNTQPCSGYKPINLDATTVTIRVMATPALIASEQLILSIPSN